MKTAGHWKEDRVSKSGRLRSDPANGVNNAVAQPRLRNGKLVANDFHIHDAPFIRAVSIRSMYTLAQHAFLTVVDGHCVFLDLRDDKYLCLSRGHTEAIKELVDGDTDLLSRPLWASDSGDDTACATVLRVLVSRGLLVQCASIEDTEPRPTLPPPKSAISEVSLDAAPIHVGHVLRFFWSAVRASVSLRWRGIARTVRSVRNMRPVDCEAPSVTLTMSVAQLTCVFQRLRPYYPRPYLCLFDSLALLYFLAGFSLFPKWVFAVRLQPFGAHCWLQVADRVVNDRVGQLRAYSPIMYV